MTAGELGAASHCREQSAAEEHLSSQSVHLRVEAAGLHGGGGKAAASKVDTGGMREGVRAHFFPTYSVGRRWETFFRVTLFRRLPRERDGVYPRQ